MAAALPVTAAAATTPLIPYTTTTYTTGLILPTTTRRRRNSRLVLRRPTTTTIVASGGSMPSTRIVRCPSLDRHAAAHNRLRFVRKLTTLLLSKPRNFLPIRVLRRCRAYLAPSRPLLQMILRYPAVFRVFRAPSAAHPSSLSVLAVGLTPAAAALAGEESLLRARLDSSLAAKLQRLLMLSSHRRLLLSKLVHIGPDLGLPVDFRSRLCNRHPDRFRTIDTSYGRALELVAWDPSLAVPLPPPADIQRPADRPIIDRPPKFRQLRLRKGLNLKRRHVDYLLRFQDLPEVSPYSPSEEAEAAGLAERRACAVVREVLAMTVEQRTLVDHLTHFRKELGLPNKLRGLLVRHPEMFYVSIKGKRDSVFLLEGYDDKGRLVAEDELLAARGRLLELVREGKRMRRERRKSTSYDDDDEEEEEESDEGDDEDSGLIGEDEEGDLEDLFETGVEDDWEEFSGFGDVDADELGGVEVGEFWTVKGGSDLGSVDVW